MIFWDSVFALHFLIALTGLSANLVYFKLVVFNKGFDGYHRFAAFIIGSGNFILILSNMISTIMCLCYGSYSDRGPCGHTDSHQVMMYLHGYGEFSTTDGIFILIFERYGSVFFPDFRSSEVYKIWFVGLISLHFVGLLTYLHLMVTVRTLTTMLVAMSSLSFIYLSSFALVVFLLLFAKKKYYKTLGLISLSQRFMLSESYELSRSILPAILVTLIINNSYLTTTWLLILGYIFQDSFYEYFTVGNMILNISSTLFPLLFLYGSKLIRKKILEITPFHQKQVPEGVGVQKLNGRRLELTQTQNEYFDQLKVTWS